MLLCFLLHVSLMFSFKFVDKIKSPIPFANDTKLHVHNVRTSKVKHWHVMPSQMRLKQRAHSRPRCIVRYANTCINSCSAACDTPKDIFINYESRRRLFYRLADLLACKTGLQINFPMISSDADLLNLSVALRAFETKT